MAAFSRGTPLLVLTLWSAVAMLPTASQYIRGEQFKLWDSSRNLGLKYVEPLPAAPTGTDYVTILLECTSDQSKAIEVIWRDDYNMVDASDSDKVSFFSYFRWQIN